jgi:hypothetical protein
MNTLAKVAGVVAALLVWLGLAVLSSYDQADGAVAERPCGVSQSEYRTLREHSGPDARSWTVARVERFVGEPGQVESFGGVPLVLSWPTCAPCDGVKVVAYFDRFGGELRLLSLSRWSDFVENPPPADCR